MTARQLVRDQRGTTLPELMVGPGAGLVVLVGLTTLIIVTVHTTTRVSARVDATQRARIAITKVLDQLHSACIAPKVPPIRAGSSDTALAFVHAPGDAVSPTPILTVIGLSGTTLSQSDYAYVGGTAPLWNFDESEPESTRQLMTHVSPISRHRSRVLLLRLLQRRGLAMPLAEPLSTTSASQTIFVKVAFQVAPTARAQRGSGDPGPHPGRRHPPAHLGLRSTKQLRARHASEPRRDNEGGFTMISVVLGLSLVVALAIVAVSAVNGDIHLTRNDLDHRRAYEAAKAGINDYVFHLHDETDYWTNCDDVRQARRTTRSTSWGRPTEAARPCPA